MTALIKAARGNINTRHGEQIGRGFPHVGIDIGWGGGTELYAPAAGWLSWAWAGTYGNLATITHADGSYSRIAHAAEYFGANGRAVDQGDHIGTMGRTGGPWGTAGWYVHCHQEYWIDGRAVDPEDYLTSTPAGGGTKPIGDEFDMASLEDLQRIVDGAKDATRRDARARLYRNAETGQLIAVNWHLPTGDPARIMYANDGEHQARRWFDPYQVVGDSPEQAKNLSPTEWESLLRLADGTDSAYTERNLPLSS